MKKIYVIIITAIIFYANVSAQTFQWAKQYGDSTGTAITDSRIIKIDANGNSIIYGMFNGASDFDPGPSQNVLISAGSNDLFITKLDVDGNYIWSKRIGNSASEFASAMNIDNQGNVYFTGLFSGTVDFDPSVSAFNLTSNGTNDIFIAKLDLNGNFVWAKQVGNSGIFDEAWGITLDNLGNLYYTGAFAGTVDFDPGPGTFNLFQSTGSQNIFISKLDLNGNFVWAKQIQGTNGSGYGRSITMDSNNDLVIGGYFSSNMDFDPGAGSFVMSGSGNDIFILKLDLNGNFVFAKQFGGSGVDAIYYDGSIVINSMNEIFFISEFTSTADYDPGIGILNLSSNGGQDVAITKLSSSGNLIWAISFGSLSFDRLNGIGLDNQDNLYVVGRGIDTFDIDVGSGVFDIMINSGGYIAKFDSSGNFIWAGSINRGSLNSIAFDSNYYLYFCGDFRFSPDVDFNAGVYVINSPNSNDGVVLKYAPCSFPPSQPSSISGIATICSGTTNTYSVAAVSGATSYTWTLPSGWTGTSTTNSINATSDASSGTISVTADNACGSSSAQNLVVTVNTIPSSPGTISGTTTICSGTTNTYSVATVAGATSYTWTLPGGWTGTSTTNSINVTSDASSGTISVTADNACGSSSAQNLAITVNTVPTMPPTVTGSTSFCEDASSQTYSVVNDASATSYTWTLPGGWSGSSTTNSINVNAGTSGGTISVTANNSCGSSATQTLSVTVNPLPSVSLTLSVDTLCSNSGTITLTGGNPSGGTFSGTGVTGGNFDPNAAGTGSHIITYTFTDANSCTNTSTDNIVVDLCLGIDYPHKSIISVYPNPSAGIIFVKGLDNYKGGMILIVDVIGNIVQQTTITESSKTIDLSSTSTGIYFLQVRSNSETVNIKIVKE